MYNLSNKSILVTGATGYLGREISKGLSTLGATVYVNSRTERDCKSLVEEIQAMGGKARIACFDVTSDIHVSKFVQELEHLDVLVNNSYAGAGGTVATSEMEHYRSSYETSVVASANLIKQLLPKLKESVERHGSASVINIASIYGMVSPDRSIYDFPGSTNPPFYGSAKAALIQFTRYAACEFAKERIRINSISPGPFPSLKTQKNSPELVDRIISKVPMGRIGKACELIGPVAFLASDASTYVTGINLPVDGGWTAW